MNSPASHCVGNGSMVYSEMTLDHCEAGSEMPDHPENLDAVLDRVSGFWSEEDIARLKDAYQFAEAAHIRSSAIRWRSRRSSRRLRPIRPRSSLAYCMMSSKTQMSLSSR